MAQGIWEYEKKHLMAGLRWEGLGGSNFCRWEGAPWWEEVGEGAPWRKARQCFGASCACRTAHSASLQSSDHNKPSHSIAIVGDVKNYGEKISLSSTLSPVLCIFGKRIYSRGSWHCSAQWVKDLCPYLSISNHSYGNIGARMPIKYMILFAGCTLQLRTFQDRN